MCECQDLCSIQPRSHRDELRYAFRHSQDAAPELDNFHISFLKTSPIEQSSSVQCLWSRGDYAWKIAFILVFLKTGKNPSLPIQQLPASLTHLHTGQGQFHYLHTEQISWENDSIQGIGKSPNTDPRNGPDVSGSDNGVEDCWTVLYKFKSGE